MGRISSSSVRHLMPWLACAHSSSNVVRRPTSRPWKTVLGVRKSVLNDRIHRSAMRSSLFRQPECIVKLVQGTVSGREPCSTVCSCLLSQSEHIIKFLQGVDSGRDPSVDLLVDRICLYL